MYLHHMYAKSLLKLEEGIGVLGTGITDNCEPPCGFWEHNLDSLQEQLVLLKARAAFLVLTGKLWNGSQSTDVCFWSLEIGGRKEGALSSLSSGPSWLSLAHGKKTARQTLWFLSFFWFYYFRPNSTESKNEEPQVMHLWICVSQDRAWGKKSENNLERRKEKKKCCRYKCSLEPQKIQNRTIYGRTIKNIPKPTSL